MVCIIHQSARGPDSNRRIIHQTWLLRPGSAKEPSVELSPHGIGELYTHGSWHVAVSHASLEIDHDTNKHLFWLLGFQAPARAAAMGLHACTPAFQKIPDQIQLHKYLALKLGLGRHPNCSELKTSIFGIGLAHCNDLNPNCSESKASIFVFGLGWLTVMIWTSWNDLLYIDSLLASLCS